MIETFKQNIKHHLNHSYCSQTRGKKQKTDWRVSSHFFQWLCDHSGPCSGGACSYIDLSHVTPGQVGVFTCGAGRLSAAWARALWCDAASEGPRRLSTAASCGRLGAASGSWTPPPNWTGRTAGHTAPAHTPRLEALSGPEQDAIGMH